MQSELGRGLLRVGRVELARAAKGTVACGAPVEVRPFQDEPA